MLILANMGPKGHTKVRHIFSPEFVTYWGAKRWGGISRQEMTKCDMGKGGNLSKSVRCYVEGRGAEEAIVMQK